MTGSSIFEYIHESDRNDIAEQFGLVWPPRNDSGMDSPAPHSDDGSTPVLTSARISTPPLEKGIIIHVYADLYQLIRCVGPQ